MNKSDENVFNTEYKAMGYRNDAKVKECLKAFENDGSVLSREEAYNILVEEAEKGEINAMVWLGIIHDQEKEYISPKDCFEWFQRAAKAGSIHAKFQMGYHYLHGKYVGADEHEAFKWFRDSAMLGYPHAQNSLGTMYLRGQVSIEDDPDLCEYYDEKRRKKGWEWLLKSASQHHYSGLCNLAVLYSQGIYVEKNEDMAISLYRLAADINKKDSRARLMLEKMGVPAELNEQDIERLEGLLDDGYISL